MLSLTMTSRFNRFFKRLWKDQEAATAMEYGLIVALIAVVLITSLSLLGTDLNNTFNQISNTL